MKFYFLSSIKGVVFGWLTFAVSHPIDVIKTRI